MTNLDSSRSLPRRVLITGASSGIGAALALAYARPGADILLVGRDAGRLRGVALGVSARGAAVNYICADVRDSALLHRWIVEQDRRDPLDLVIANAGVSGGPRDGYETAQQIDAIMGINVQGVLNTVSPIIPRMIARGSGQVAIMSSLAAFAPWPGAPAYAASKAAVKTYGLALRLALRGTGVRVNVICPGFIRTPMTDINPYHMPWLMEVGEAAKIVVQGLSRDLALIAFPWQTALLARAIGMLPFALQRLILALTPTKPVLTAKDQRSNSV